MNGEIGLKIDKIRITKFEDKNYEITFYGGNDCFHICGDNDIKTLLEDALNNIIEWKPHIKGIIKS